MVAKTQTSSREATSHRLWTLARARWISKGAQPVTVWSNSFLFDELERPFSLHANGKSRAEIACSSLYWLVPLYSIGAREKPHDLYWLSISFWTDYYASSDLMYWKMCYSSVEIYWEYIFLSTLLMAFLITYPSMHFAMRFLNAKWRRNFCMMPGVNVTEVVTLWESGSRKGASHVARKPHWFGRVDRKGQAGIIFEEEHDNSLF